MANVKAHISINKARYVAAATAIATPVAAVVTAWLSRHAPGVHIPSKDETASLLVGASAILLPAITWLVGNAKFEFAKLFGTNAPTLIKHYAVTAAGVIETADPGLIGQAEAAVKDEAVKVAEAAGASAATVAGVEKVAQTVVADVAPAEAWPVEAAATDAPAAPATPQTPIGVATPALSGAAAAAAGLPVPPAATTTRAFGV